jgi:hypothetical protein
LKGRDAKSLDVKMVKCKSMERNMTDLWERRIWGEENPDKFNPIPALQKKLHLVREK